MCWVQHLTTSARKEGFSLYQISTKFHCIEPVLRTLELVVCHSLSLRLSGSPTLSCPLDQPHCLYHLINLHRTYTCTATFLWLCTKELKTHTLHLVAIWRIFLVSVPVDSDVLLLLNILTYHCLHTYYHTFPFFIYRQVMLLFLLRVKKIF